MPTKLTVFNSALGLLAQPLMEDADAAGTDGDTLRSHWDSVVDLCHEKTAWDQAKTRAILAQSATTPTHGYDYYYTLPADCLRILRLSPTGAIGDDLIHYEPEMGKIATDATAVYITYVSSTSRTAVGRWSESFAYYVATELAVRAAPKLNSSALDFVTKERKKALSDAVGLDAAQGPPIERRHGSWSRAARGGTSNREQG